MKVWVIPSDHEPQPVEVLEEGKGGMSLDDPSVGSGKRNDLADGKMESQRRSE